jgi:hypothetical protein
MECSVDMGRTAESNRMTMQVRRAGNEEHDLAPQDISKSGIQWHYCSPFIAVLVKLLKVAG